MEELRVMCCRSVPSELSFECLLCAGRTSGTDKIGVWSGRSLESTLLSLKGSSELPVL